MDDVELARDGDDDAAHRLFAQYKGYGRSLRWKARAQGYYSIDDADAATMAGIAMALADYDKRRGTKFSTVVFIKIRELVQKDIKVYTYKSTADIRGTRGRRRTSPQTFELDRPLGGNADEDATFGDFIPAPELTPEDAIVAPEQEREHKLALQKLRLLRKRLPVAERQLLRGMYEQGVPQTVIAQKNGVAKSTVSRHVHRIYDKLRGEMEKT